MKTELTPQESAQLIELGVDPKLASKKKFVPLHPEVLKGNTKYVHPWGWFPIFNLVDILNILPSEIYSEERDIFYSLTIVKSKFGARSYYGLYGYTKGYGPQKTAPELIDALRQLLIWCINNGRYKPKNKEK